MQVERNMMWRKSKDEPMTERMFIEGEGYREALAQHWRLVNGSNRRCMCEAYERKKRKYQDRANSLSAQF